jgi:Flp pilus assembly protein TadB
VLSDVAPDENALVMGANADEMSMRCKTALVCSACGSDWPCRNADRAKHYALTREQKSLDQRLQRQAAEEQLNRMLEQEAELRREEQRRHQAWLKTPEGRRWRRRQRLGAFLGALWALACKAPKVLIWLIQILILIAIFLLLQGDPCSYGPNPACAAGP